MKFDYLKLENRLKHVMDKIERSDTDPKNKELIKNYINYLQSLGYGIATLRNNAWHLEIIADYVKKPFTTAVKDDIIELVKNIEVHYKNQTTKLILKNAIKKFWKWLSQTDGYPAEVQWIKLKPVTYSNSESFLTEEEVQRMIDCVDSVRDKAFVSLLWETAMRIGEAVTLQFKDLTFDDCGCVLAIEGKTGKRLVRIVESNKYFMQWLDINPAKNDPEGFVFTANGKTNLSYSTSYAILKKLKEKAKITKRTNPHSLRKGSSTKLSEELPEAIVKKYCGWTADSKMLKVYQNISSDSVDQKILQMRGIKPEVKPKTIEKKVCSKCGEVNSILTGFCKSCKMPLDLKTFIQIDNTRNEYDHFVKDFLLELANRNPKTKELFVKMVKERKLEHLFGDINESERIK